MICLLLLFIFSQSHVGSGFHHAETEPSSRWNFKVPKLHSYEIEAIKKKKNKIVSPIKYWRPKLYLINPKAVIVLYPQLWLLGFVPTGRL